MIDKGTDSAPSTPPSEPTSVQEPSVKKKGLPGWAKAVGAIAILAVIILAGRFLPLADWFFTATEWIEGQGAVGVVVYILLYAGATLIGGATPLTLAAGIIYGLWGVALVSPASVLGATIAFILGRSALRKSIEAKVSTNPKFSAIFDAVGKNGFKIVALLRLSPAFPFTLLNYGLGLTSVKLWQYVLASFIGMLPGTFMYVYFGVLAGDLASVFKGTPSTQIELTLDGNDEFLAIIPEKGGALSDPPGWMPEGVASFLTGRKAVTLEVVPTGKAKPPELTYRWDPGDGGEALTGAKVKHRYRKSGELIVLLEILEGERLVDEGQATITVGESQGPFDDYGQGILLIVGLLATVVVTVVVTRIARKALGDSLGDDRAQTTEESA